MDNEQLKLVYAEVVSQLNRLEKELSELVDSYDPVELLSRVALLMDNPFQDLIGNGNPHELPILYLLTSISLTTRHHSSQVPTSQEVLHVVDVVEKYFFAHNAHEYLKSTHDNSANQDSASDITHLARSLKILGYVNPDSYTFQQADYLRRVYGPLNPYFSEKFGFSSMQAWDFASDISTHIHSIFSNEDLKYRMFSDVLRKALDSIPDNEDELSQDQCQELYQDLLDIYGETCPKMFQIDQKMTLAAPENREAFEAYLTHMSCSFGNNADFDGLLSDSIILNRPIIRVDDSYFVPIVSYLHHRLPSVFEGFLEHDKNVNSRNWQRFISLRSNYLEECTKEYFCRVFPRSTVYSKLFYRRNNQRNESDVLIHYGDCLFVAECKSGQLTQSAKRGGVKRIENDLRKLIADALKQCKTTLSYIWNTNRAQFTNEKGREVVTVKSQEVRRTFSICVTQEALSFFVTDLGYLRELKLIEDTDFIWTISLSDLDVITDHINSPAVFIHYLLHRQRLDRMGFVKAPDELTFLGAYFDYGLELEKAASEQSDVMMLRPDYASRFDEHYLFQEPKSTLKIPPFLQQILDLLEREHPENSLEFLLFLLDLPRSLQIDIGHTIQELLQAHENNGQDLGKFVAFEALGGKIGLSILVLNADTGVPTHLAKLSNYRDRYHLKQAFALTYVSRENKPTLRELLYANFKESRGTAQIFSF